jgi:hypothetical protein
MPKPDNSFFQCAWIVNDLLAAAERWTRFAGIGPFYLMPRVSMDDMIYRGQPSWMEISGAIAQAGAIQIELIEQHGDTPSAYREVYPAGQEGMHHVARMTNDFDGEAARFRDAGIDLVMSSRFGDMRGAYFDTRTALGHMTEIIEARESIKSIFAIVADAARDWDGRDPIRYLPDNQQRTSESEP